MAIFNTARLRDVLVRSEVATPPAAAEVVDELEEQMDGVLSNYPTLDRLDSMEQRLLREMAEVKQYLAGLETRMAESEARIAEMMRQQSVHTNQAVGILLAGLALAVGLILGFG